MNKLLSLKAKREMAKGRQKNARASEGYLNVLYLKVCLLGSESATRHLDVILVSTPYTSETKLRPSFRYWNKTWRTNHSDTRTSSVSGLQRRIMLHWNVLIPCSTRSASMINTQDSSMLQPLQISHHNNRQKCAVKTPTPIPPVALKPSALRGSQVKSGIRYVLCGNQSINIKRETWSYKSHPNHTDQQEYM